MFKLIIKNIWSRRKRNGWLLAELVIVTVLAWIILDPVIVRTYISQRSPGYDIERIARITMLAESKQSPRYDAEADTPEGRRDAARRIIDRIAAYSGVEMVAPVSRWAMFESQGSSWRSININDSTSINVSIVTFAAGSPFFELFGLKGVPGSPTASQLAEITYGPGEVVINESMARAFFPDGRATGHYLMENTPGFEGPSPDGDSFRVAGVVNDAVTRSIYGRNMIMYCSEPMDDMLSANCEYYNIVLRIKPGVNMASFINDFRPFMKSELKSGNLKAYDIKDLVSARDELDLTQGITNDMRIKIALAVFFLVNLCLGVIGTFYLQTRKRSEDAGVMRSFGATPRYIMREMLGEGWVLTTLAWLVGCLAYMQYAIKEGLEVTGSVTGWGPKLAAFMPDWTDNFFLHFSIVSLIIYVILMIVVSVGIYIPARRIIRVSPVDALRDE